MNEDMLQAYSRDPRTLLRNMHEGTPRAHQPMTYPAGLLLLQLPQPAELVTVDWVKGRVTTYATREDFMNRVPDQISGLAAVAATEPTSVYVRETLAFLLRGHSLFHPQCLCRHGDAARRATLGFVDAPPQQPQPQPPPPPPPPPKNMVMMVPPTKKKRKTTQQQQRAAVVVAAAAAPPRECPLLLVNNTERGGGRTVQEIELELGVRDLQGLVLVHLGEAGRAYHLPLIRVLTELAGLTVLAQQPLLRLGLPSCSPAHAYREIETAQQIEALARQLSPRPYVYVPGAFDVVVQRALNEQLCAAFRVRRVRILDADTKGAYAVFWDNHHNHNNDDPATAKRLRALWNAHCDRSRVLTTTVHDDDAFSLPIVVVRPRC